MRYYSKYLFSLASLLLPFIGLSQIPTPAEGTHQKVLIRYATAHIGNGEVIQNSIIVIENGEFSIVGNADHMRINELDYDTIIDADQKHVYPGFIVMDSRLGLTEIDQVNATHDYAETGEFLPNVRSLPAFNTESKIIPTIRTNGVLMAQIAPVGATISGSASVVHFDGWNWQDAAIKSDEGVYLNWPDRYHFSGWWGEPVSAKTSKKYLESINEIEKWLIEAKSYCGKELVTEKNLRFEAMRGIFDGSERMYVRVNWAKDILDVVQLKRKLGIQKLAIVGGSEANFVTNELKENDIPVIIDRVHRVPDHEDDPLDCTYTLTKELIAQGVEVALATNGQMEAMITRNLPFQVGTAIHYGLDPEKALKCLTQTPAMILGIDSDYGTLTSGKRATCFISTGDPFDMKTNNIEVAFIEGKMIDLNNHQKELYLKYCRKYGAQP